MLRNHTVVGLDIGSRGTKAVLLHEGCIYYTMVISGVSSKDTGHRIIEQLLEEAGLAWKDLEYLVGTGYGRVALDFQEVPQQAVTEISCHGMCVYSVERREESG